MTDARPTKPVILIPARMASTRLPDKPLADIHGLPMIVHVWRRAMEAGIGPVFVSSTRLPFEDWRLVTAIPRATFAGDIDGSLGGNPPAAAIADSTVDCPGSVYEPGRCAGPTTNTRSRLCGTNSLASIMKQST